MPAVPDGQAHLSQEEPVLDTEDCEYPFCYARIENNGWSVHAVAGYMNSAWKT